MGDSQGPYQAYGAAIGRYRRGAPMLTEQKPETLLSQWTGVAARPPPPRFNKSLAAPGGAFSAYTKQMSGCKGTHLGRFVAIVSAPRCYVAL